MIIRVCAAIIRENQILMVRHHHDGREYWTLPGGGVEINETPEEAAIREVWEETGLITTTKRTLFDEKFGGEGKWCRCFLMNETQLDQVPLLGHDPEEQNKPPALRMLQGISWHSLKSMKDDIQVSKVIEAINKTEENT